MYHKQLSMPTVLTENKILEGVRSEYFEVYCNRLVMREKKGKALYCGITTLATVFDTSMVHAQPREVTREADFATNKQRRRQTNARSSSYFVGYDFSLIVCCTLKLSQDRIPQLFCCCT